MFSKRQLGPQACASCEKDLVNMHGLSADHYVWKKLPFRDPNERISKYGKGFSRMLSEVRSFSTQELAPNEMGNNRTRNQQSTLQTTTNHIASVDDLTVNESPGARSGLKFRMP